LSTRGENNNNHKDEKNSVAKDENDKKISEAKDEDCNKNKKKIYNEWSNYKSHVIILHPEDQLIKYHGEKVND